MCERCETLGETLGARLRTLLLTVRREQLWYSGWALGKWRSDGLLNQGWSVDRQRDRVFQVGKQERFGTTPKFDFSPHLLLFV